MSYHCNGCKTKEVDSMCGKYIYAKVSMYWCEKTIVSMEKKIRGTSDRLHYGDGEAGPSGPVTVCHILSYRSVE